MIDPLSGQMIPMEDGPADGRCCLYRGRILDLALPAKVGNLEDGMPMLDLKLTQYVLVIYQLQGRAVPRYVWGKSPKLKLNASTERN